MKKTVRQILGMLLISSVSIYVYDHYFKQTQIIIQESPLNRPVQLTDLLLSDGLEKHFNSSSPTDFITAANKARPGVVYIQAKEKEVSQNKHDMKSAGSGVVVSPDGFIVTNNHVIEGAENIIVTLNDRRTFDAKLIGIDLTTDLALLKIEAEHVPYLIFGNSDSLQVGEWVMAIGSPFKLQSTVTAGIVSAKARDIDILDLDYGIESFIQTDAAVNPGNSGGALVNTNGDLVGISTAIITYSGNYEGYSFAIPSNLARKVINDLKEFGTVHRGLLGIEVSSVKSGQVEQLKLKEVAGVLITLVYAKSGANEAGLIAGDVITHVGDSKIRTRSELMEITGRSRPGEKIKLGYIRDGKLAYTSVTLKNQLNTTDLVTVRRDKVLSNLGFELRELIQSEKRNTKLQGIKVVSILKGSKIAQTKMEPGYIITRINEQAINNVDQFIDAINNTEGRIFLEGYYELHGGPWWYAFDN